MITILLTSIVTILIVLLSRVNAFLSASVVGVRGSDVSTLGRGTVEVEPSMDEGALESVGVDVGESALPETLR